MSLRKYPDLMDKTVEKMNRMVYIFLSITCRFVRYIELFYKRHDILRPSTCQ